LLFALGSLCASLRPAAAADTNALLTAWLDSQKNIKTWSADFVQTRSLKSFSQPLTATGHVWFAAPNQFRWELGHPPQTIAVRQPEQMLVIYPKLKRVEKYPLTGQQMGQWKDTMALLEAGFPRDRSDLDSRFKIVSLTVTGDVCDLVLQPRSAAARKMMPQMKIGFGTDGSTLRSTELEFADGSTMRNDFRDPKLNENFGQEKFEPKLEADYKITEPLKQK
jgi:outer membrane lipoprotein-sorting protein